MHFHLTSPKTFKGPWHSSDNFESIPFPKPLVFASYTQIKSWLLSFPEYRNTWGTLSFRPIYRVDPSHFPHTIPSFKNPSFVFCFHCLSRYTHLSARLYPFRLCLYWKAEVFQWLCPSEMLVWFKRTIAFLRASHRRFIATGAIHLTWALNAGERRQLKAGDVPVSACRCNGPRRVDLKAH